MKGLEYQLIFDGQKDIRIKNAPTLPQVGDVIRYKDKSYEVKEVVHQLSNEGGLVNIAIETFQIED